MLDSVLCIAASQPHKHCSVIYQNKPHDRNKPGQLSLAIPPWVGAMSTRESRDVIRDTTRDALAPIRGLAV